MSRSNGISPHQKNLDHNSISLKFVREFSAVSLYNIYTYRHPCINAKSLTISLKVQARRADYAAGQKNHFEGTAKIQHHIHPL
jgi:hypothetical protein